ncbi:MAG TPA: class I SAM-dependent methyltransferase [Anaerolineales bacterium]|nr:class I SAM-dependent methyltransferase [Anaerolineales bacterium]
METVACNLCGATETTTRYQILDYLMNRDVQTTLVECQKCGLVYQNPRPTLDEMGVHYPPDYESYAPPPGKSTPRVLQMIYDYGRFKRARVVTRLQKSGGHLLDIGCSTGTFLLTMRDRPGWKVSGVEISEHPARIAREEYGLDVFTGTLDDAHFPDNTFDAITLWDVFEHLHDPAATLREIHRVLKPGGLLVMRVPNFDSWDAKLFGSAWAGLDSPRHLYIFGVKTLRQMLAQQHFQVEKMSCEIGSYPTFVLSVRFWMQQRGWKAKTREGVARWLYHPIVRVLSGPFFYLYGLGLRGPLVIAAARKK